MNIMELKEKDGRGYNQLARDSGLGVAIVWRVINGRTRRPSMQTVAKLATILGVDVGTLIGAIGESNSSKNGTIVP